jgi:RimJ/RimL family protein N-acetyltransferase
MKNALPKYIIETEHLQLMACAPEHYAALLRDKQELGALLKIKVPDTWPVFPESVSPQVYEFIRTHLSEMEWGFYLFIHRQDRVLVGEGGFKGKPDEEGMVEIGYAFVPEYRGRGLATEAARAFTHHAFSKPEVKTVQAHTLPDGKESIRVLEKLGMKLIGTFHDPEDGDVLRWGVERKDFRNAE